MSAPNLHHDFAFLRIGPGRFACGTGPFESQPEPPSDGRPAFYINDFELSDPEPWKVSTHAFETSDVRQLLPDNGSTPLPAVEWHGLGDGDFREIYDAIQQEIAAGTLEKSVPVITERGRLNGGDPAALLKAVTGSSAELCGYGYRLGTLGMIGATPEQLFNVHDGLLETMALAGTAPRHEAGDFLSDPKEIREHEFVAAYLVEKMSEIGQIERETRSVMDLGSLVHFLSRIRVRLNDPHPDLNALIRLMHPTPALGAYPRGEGALRMLCEYRERLKAPPHFGAPFGVMWEGAFRSVVAIRNVSWSGSDMFLPSGCGIIRESRFDREWRELALKRNSVKALLGV
ncbi:MAG: chorismate-binding protein [Verrucomicrobiae bacterium]|nr:chorismate-binding protein [Verrucomicrobiae bacterium]